MIGRQAYKKNIQSIPKRKAEITCVNGEIKKTRHYKVSL